MSTSIPISGLNETTVVNSEDFIPVVISSSLTTFRSTFDTIGNWISSSVEASSSVSSVSASYAFTTSISVSSSFANEAQNSVNSGYALLAGSSFTSSFLNGNGKGNLVGTSSWAINSVNALSASQAISTLSSSWASSSFTSVSASYSNRSTLANTASFALYTQTASLALYAPTASYAVTAVTAITASYALNSVGGLVYPYIYYIQMNCSNDDWVDIYINGLTYNMGNSNGPGWSNTGTDGSPTTGTGSLDTVVYVPTQGTYYLYQSGVQKYILGSSVQSLAIASDNRGGSTTFWYHLNPMIVQIAIAPNTVLNYNYTTTKSTNWAGTMWMINAVMGSKNYSPVYVNSSNPSTPYVPFAYSSSIITIAGA